MEKFHFYWDQRHRYVHQTLLGFVYMLFSMEKRRRLCSEAFAGFKT